MGKDFVHLHVHTHYSINDGLAQIKDLVEKAVKNGMPGMAITNHGILTTKLVAKYSKR